MDSTAAPAVQTTTAANKSSPAVVGGMVAGTVIVLAICTYLMFRIRKRRGPVWADRCPPIPRATHADDDDDSVLGTSLMRSTRVEAPKLSSRGGKDSAKGKLSAREPSDGSKMASGGSKVAAGSKSTPSPGDSKKAKAAKTVLPKAAAAPKAKAAGKLPIGKKG